MDVEVPLRGRVNVGAGFPRRAIGGWVLGKWHDLPQLVGAGGRDLNWLGKFSTGEVIWLEVSEWD